MHLNATAGALLLAGALAGVGAAAANEQSRTSTSQATSGASAARQSDSEARQILKDTGRVLGAAKTLRFQVRSLLPMESKSGQWLTLIGSGEAVREGNSQLFVRTGGDLFPYEVYYNGKSLVALAPQENVFASRPAPSTIDAMIAQARQRSAFALPFADVLMSDPYAAMMEGTTRGMVVGTSTIDGVETSHLAFEGPKLAWQIWIGKSDHLPRMVMLTDLTDAARPSQLLEFSGWSLNGAVSPRMFTFENRTGAREVPFRSPTATAQARRTR